ncbi:histidine kinase [Crossiella sp. CA-258035]|uniref:histidine kinase n=1 Tax=Crossiella sp. CA-258035 TaxID=2981138 RepID=UPI0024BCA704|nr:histidine kinase [Crossiella sp. CA-258035]WHT20550.1 histidine kinase [Crossiella sp. CA-258035]
MSGSRGRVILVAAFAVLSVALAVVCVLSRALAPSDGTLVNQNDFATPDGVVKVLGETRDGPLRVGDVIIAIDGRDTSEGARQPGGPAFREGQTLDYEVLRGRERLTIPVTLTQYPLLGQLIHNWPNLLVLFLLFGAAVYLFARRPRDPAARAAVVASSIAMITLAGSGYFGIEALDLIAGEQFYRWYGGQIFWVLLWGGMLHFALAYPEVTTKTRYGLLLALGYGGGLVLYGATVAIGLPMTDNPVEALNVWASPIRTVLFVYPLLVFGVLVHKYRASKSHLTRMRLRWLAASLGLATVLYALLWGLPVALFGEEIFAYQYHVLVFLPVPLTVAMAVLRYQVMDIEIVLSRSATYVILSVFVVCGYLALVGLLRWLVLPHSNDLAEQAVAAAAAALIVLPLHDRLAKLVNERLFGYRDDPYRVVSALSARLEQTQTPEAMLPALVETIGHALRLPYTAIELERDKGLEVVADYGEPVGEPVRLPLVYQGERIGDLVVCARGAGEEFNDPDLRVLADVARHAGAVAYTARLTTDLARSRSRLVRAREEERRRLLHDLHDGVGPTLAAAALGLQVVRQVMNTNQGAAEEMLSRLEDELQGAIGEIRRVAHGLRPPVLDQLGLATAVREHAATLAGRIGGNGDAPLTISVDVSDQLPPLPAAVEVAAYRIVCEALTNVARHSGAQSCLVRVWLDRDLHVEVLDDGLGLGETRRNGVGLRSMRERAGELGGDFQVESRDKVRGTRVAARLPVPREEA